MRINSNIVLMVWEEKINQYASMKLGDVKTMLFITALFAFFPMAISGFRPEAVLPCTLAYALYCTMVAAVRRRMKHIIASHYRLEYAYHHTTLLNSIYYFAFIAVIWGGMLAGGVALIRYERINIPYYPALPLGGLIVFSIVVVFLMPSKLNKAFELKAGNRVDNRYVSMAVQISIGIAAVGAFLIQILSVLVSGITLSIIYVVITYPACMLLLYYILIDMCKILLIAFGKWPEIKRDGSEFIVTYQANKNADETE